jgi:mRNA interferase HigB
VSQRKPPGRGNHYRLIAGVRYEMQRVFVLKVMTHKQYDTEDWKNECQCY